MHFDVFSKKCFLRGDSQTDLIFLRETGMGFGGKFCDFFFIGVMSLGVKGGFFFRNFFSVS